MSLRLEARLRGRLVRRYRRFFADVATEDGETLTVHCPNPGSMLGCATPGAAVRCSTSDNPRRKLRHTLEMIRAGRAWIGLHTGRANAVVARALEAGIVPELAGYGEIRREVRVGEGTRLDFALARRRGDRRAAYVEVKSVTLAEGSLALFPDSVTERGRRHVETLERLRRRGSRAVLLFLVQRADCDRVAPADAIDPAYATSLRAAARAGVEIFALGARVTARAITVERRLPVAL
ncbi:MAG: DNA/RNA nuclease SfsA [Myxococcales bacterium]|nr:DNA/RNA nuclease SfsA [Myxococcales bacterium]